MSHRALFNIASLYKCSHSIPYRTVHDHIDNTQESIKPQCDMMCDMASYHTTHSNTPHTKLQHTIPYNNSPLHTGTHHLTHHHHWTTPALQSITLHHTTLQHIIPHHTTPHHTIRYHATSFRRKKLLLCTFLPKYFIKLCLLLNCSYRK